MTNTLTSLKLFLRRIFKFFVVFKTVTRNCSEHLNNVGLESSRKLPVENIADTEPRVPESSTNSFQTISTSFKYLYIFAGFFGIHVISKDRSNNFKTSRILVICSVAVIVNATYGFLAYLWLVAYGTRPYWYVIIVLPTILGFVYVIQVAFSSLYHRKQLARYMTALNIIQVKRSNSFFSLFLGMFLLSCLVIVPLVFLVPVQCRIAVAQPLFLNTTVPVVQDLYLSTFIWAISAGHQTLEEIVRSTQTWTEDRITAIANQWINLKKLLIYHNSIFRKTFFLRLILFTAQMMSYLYTVTTYQQNSRCLPLFVVTVIIMVELLIRMAHLCKSGEAITESHLRLADAVADAMHSLGLTEDLRAPLDVLVTRLESHPAHIEIWGMERLGNGSMLRQINIVISFFVLMLQLKPNSSSSDDFQDLTELTYFDRCYDIVDYTLPVNGSSNL